MLTSSTNSVVPNFFLVCPLLLLSIIGSTGKRFLCLPFNTVIMTLFKNFIDSFCQPVQPEYSSAAGTKAFFHILVLPVLCVLPDARKGNGILLFVIWVNRPFKVPTQTDLDMDFGWAARGRSIPFNLVAQKICNRTETVVLLHHHKT